MASSPVYESTGDAMFRTEVTEKSREDGRALVDVLSAQGLPILAALWLYDPETREWQFIIGSPSVEKDGPLSVLRRVQKALDTFDDDFGVAITDVTVQNSRNTVVRGLATAVHLQGGLAHFVNCWFGHAWIAEAWAYELNADVLKKARKEAKLKAVA